MTAVASEGKLYERNALKFSAFIFVVRFPRNRWFSKKMHTSGTIAVPFGCLAAAISMEVIRFSFQSVRNMPMGSWLPVRITGLLRFSSMKLSAEAVYAMVSVPCRMTNPSKLS